MKSLPLFLSAAFLSSVLTLAKGQGKPASPPAPTSQKGEPAPPEVARLAAAIKIGRDWQDKVKAGKIEEGMKLWGYAAFEGTTPENVAKGIASLGVLSSTAVLEDRCLVDLHGSAEGAASGNDTYITLRWFSTFDKKSRRESLVLHEPAKGGNGLKIIGLRREILPKGKQAAFELAADLGQLALLKLHQAPSERWIGFEQEARALAELLKVTLPPIPDAPGGTDKEAPDKLVNLLMKDAGPVFDKLGESGGSVEAKVALNAFAMFLMYLPGDETTTRLAAMAGAEAEKAKLPDPLWKPLIEAVVRKEQVPAVHEAIQAMVAGVSSYLGLQQTAAELKIGTKETLDLAFQNMGHLPSYVVHAELTATDGKKSIMDATLGPGAMDLNLTGFDGKTQRHVVTQNGFYISKDGGKLWYEDADQETAIGLCRTLQLPVNSEEGLTEKYTFTLEGKESINGEELFRFSDTADGQPSRTYWLLVSKSGPVIRRARVPMTFGSTKADALITYTKLGRPVEIQEPTESVDTNDPNK